MKAEKFKAVKWNGVYSGVGSNDQSIEWDTLEAYAVDYEQAMKSDPDFYKYVAGMCNHRWIGCDSIDKFHHHLMHGWPELRTKLESMLANMELEVPRFPSQTEIRRRKRHRGDHGDTLDMPRVWSGDLDHAWSRPKRIMRVMPNTKRITLCFELGAHCGITNEQAMWRAALCMLLVKSLTQAGRTFEIWCQSSTGHCFNSGGPNTLRVGWCVKRAAEPVVMDKLCSMVSVGMLRTNAFMAYNMTPYIPNYSLGSPVNSGLMHGLRERQKAGEVVLRIGHCFSKYDVLDTYKRSWNEITEASKTEDAA